MAWLVTDARVLASAEVADTGKARSRGLLGRRGLDGALVLRPCHWVHTLGMKFALDIAFLDSEGKVIRIVQMRRHRMGLPVRYALLVSLRTDEQSIDLYTPIANQLRIPVPTQITAG